MNNTFYIYGYTHKGQVRRGNEDHILLGRFVKNSGGLGMYFSADDDFLLDNGMLFAVADGIGGQNAGDIASKIALIAFERQFYGIEKKNLDINRYMEIIAAAGTRANDTILKMFAEKPGWAGMGSTISGVCLMNPGYLVYNAGDSRVYRYRNGTLKPLTVDDTITNLAVQSGQMNFQEAEESEKRHTLTNSLGSRSFNLNIKMGPEPREEDMILICSDGLHDLVDHDRMELLVKPDQTVEENVMTLIREALNNGGHDNISIILIRLQTDKGNDKGKGNKGEEKNGR